MCGGAVLPFEAAIGRPRRRVSEPTELARTARRRPCRTVTLPVELREILAWHEATFLVARNVAGTDRPNLTASKRSASELLFPSRAGGFQSTSSLQKPFANISEAMKKETSGKFTKVITPKGMRRTSKWPFRPGEHLASDPGPAARRRNSHAPAGRIHPGGCTPARARSECAAPESSCLNTGDRQCQEAGGSGVDPVAPRRRPQWPEQA